MDKPSIVHSNSEIMGGTTVFRSTSVPFQTLIDYLEAGHPPGEFFSTTSRQ
jgi:uncharacterized protein (DUF433 family)